jgi:hypothetical protein
VTAPAARRPLDRDAAEGSAHEIDGPKHLLLFDDFPRRVRAVLGGHTVLDTRAGKLLHETDL